MFKTKLQELCQKRSWSLPEYSTTKQGLDHNPSFSATVFVNDQSFQTLSLYKSSKEAQNDAARLAFEHFSLPIPNSNPNPNPNSRPLIPSPSSFPQPSLLSPSGYSSGSVAINQMDGVHGTGETLQQQIQETQQTPPAGDGTSIVQGDNKIKGQKLFCVFSSVTCYYYHNYSYPD
ncbi:Double-stranded RNA-binding protein 1 [Morus notabilis]|uniref:Double-stranded RNA-binding protein 1 n=1 Tax=Morus notabilis TaxID=981085 RepID=W9SWC1_9ROSA|nr:Double-stranded RNA-binding protein 1 [Morus notabilis]